MAYTQHKKLRHRVIHLDNRELAIFIGVILGFCVGVYGVSLSNFINIAVLGTSYKHSWLFKIFTITLCAGTFGNLFSYVGAFFDIITNHRTIFDLFKIKCKTNI